MKSSVIRRDPGILGATPVFAGTRVPVRNFLDCIEGGYTIDGFLEDFPTVKKALGQITDRERTEERS